MFCIKYIGKNKKFTRENYCFLIISNKNKDDKIEQSDEKNLSVMINIFIAVWLVNFRLYPMTVSLFPLLKHKSQPKWKYYLSSHFLAVSSWLVAKEGYQKIDKKYRIDFWIGIGIGTWSTAVIMTIIGYLLSGYLNKDMMIGLAIVNPVYFFCMMIGAMKNISISIAVVGGTILGPIVYLFSAEWAILYAGLIAGTIAFLLGDKNGSK